MFRILPFTVTLVAARDLVPKAMLLDEIKNAMAHQHSMMRPASSIDFNRKEFVDVFLGIAEGMELQLVETCVEDSLDFEKQVTDSIEGFTGKNMESVAEGLRQIGVAVGHTLPKALRVCHGSYAEIADLIKAQSAFASPEQFAYHLGKDLWVNGVDIYKNINGAIAAWKGKQYHSFGINIGTAMREVIIGMKNQEAALVKAGKAADIDLFSSKATTVRVVTTDGAIEHLPGPSDGIDFTLGLFQGFGVDVPQECVTDDDQLGKLLDAAAAAAAKQTVAGIAIAMEMLARAYRMVLPEVEKECGPSVSAAVKEVEDALDNFSSPYEIIVRFGHNIEVNEIEIMAELAGFVSDFKNGSYKDAGGYIGRALKLVVIGTDKNKDIPKRISDIYV